MVVPAAAADRANLDSGDAADDWLDAYAVGEGPEGRIPILEWAVTQDIWPLIERIDPTQAELEAVERRRAAVGSAPAIEAAVGAMNRSNYGGHWLDLDGYINIAYVTDKPDPAAFPTGVIWHKRDRSVDELTRLAEERGHGLDIIRGTTISLEAFDRIGDPDDKHSAPGTGWTVCVVTTQQGDDPLSSDPDFHVYEIGAFVQCGVSGGPLTTGSTPLYTILNLPYGAVGGDSGGPVLSVSSTNAPLAAGIMISAAGENPCCYEPNKIVAYQLNRHIVDAMRGLFPSQFDPTLEICVEDANDSYEYDCD